MDIRVLRPGDDGLVAAASHLFDGPARPDATARFLAEDGHHLLVAYEDERAVGFVSGVEVTHPDKGTEMFLYELAVDEPFRRRGIGRALVERLAALARAAGCYGMWVVTDEDNEAARATYEGTGGVPETAAGRRGLDLLAPRRARQGSGDAGRRGRVGQSQSAATASAEPMRLSTTRFEMAVRAGRPPKAVSRTKMHVTKVM